jgi:hypothetical protein
MILAFMDFEKSEEQYKDNRELVKFNDIKVSEHLVEQVKVK